MDKYHIHNMLEDITEVANTELSKGIENVNTKEMGEVVDMIKDLSEAEKNKMEACYYQTVIEAMEDSEYGEDYDWEGRKRGFSRGDIVMPRRSGYEQPMMMNDRMQGYSQGRMGYSNGAYGGGRRNQTQSGGSRYGYSHDEYMNNKSMHKGQTPEDMKARTEMIEDRMDDLYDMFKEEVKDMTPEEKQLWKTKISKIINL